MNSLIETLNHCGDDGLRLAGPMLWQSSLLIAVVFAFDFLLRRRLRASIRYALWLVVLVKLCLPPTLALPTSPAWWLNRTPAPVAAKPPAHYTVTVGEATLVPLPEFTVPAFVPPPPTLTRTAWLLAISVVVSLALLVWLLVRWWQVARLVRRAQPSTRLAALAAELPLATGAVPVKLIPDTLSPAVCGLFRPAILIPQTLAENFSDDQLRAVLLHELMHLRRRDVWLNFLQSLLQIVYWWHPLVWLANTRIRRVREEAVDDAVMLALRDEAESYAPTLLAVAKLALNRPLASLGLVGILESRRALRQRIERLVDFQPPRQAGLTLVSLLGILAFTAVAVPMGEGPARTEQANPPQPATPASSTAANAPTVLIQAQIYQMRQSDFQMLVSNPAFTESRNDKVKNFQAFLRLLQASELQHISSPRIMTRSGMPAMLFVGNETNGIEFECRPAVTNGLIDLTSQIKIISTKDGVTATNQLTNQFVSANGGGHVFSINAPGDASGSNIFVAAIGVEIITNAVVSRPQTIGMLNDTNFQMVRHALEQRSGKESLAEPEGVTTSGRGINRISMPNISVPLAKADTGQLVRDGKLLYEMGKLDQAMEKFQAALTLNPEDSTARYYSNLIAGVKQERTISRSIPGTKDSAPTNASAPQRTYSDIGRPAIMRKLSAIRLDRVDFKATPLRNVLRVLSKEARERDPEKRGINFMINPNTDQAATGKSLDPVTGLLLATNAPPATDLGALPIKVQLTNATLGDVLDALVLAAPAPIQYSVQDYAIVFSHHKPEVQLFNRVFKIDPERVFGKLLGTVTNQWSTNIAALRNAFVRAGVNLDSPPGKALFFNQSNNGIFVRSTLADLDKIENLLSELSQVPPQLHIKARFVLVSMEGSTGFMAFANGSNSAAAEFTGILSATNAKAILRTLEARKDTEILAEPEVTTLTGRQTQMRATEVITIVTNLVLHAGVGETNSIIPQTTKVETGPMLDVVPYVMADGYTIHLSLIPSFTEFLGYEKTTNTHASYTPSGEKVDVPEIRPLFRNQNLPTQVNVWDGQTVLLGGMTVTNSAAHEIPGWLRSGENSRPGRLFVFVTADIVDPAGNRVHTDDELPFANRGIPPQPEKK